MSRIRIGLVGGGATGLYLLRHLLDSDHDLDITVLEAAPDAGPGMPYYDRLNADYMLCNAFSREIPAVTRSFFDWLSEQPEQELSDWAVSPDDISPRAFYPRTLLGEFFKAEVHALSRQAVRRSRSVRVRTGIRVIDIAPGIGQALVRAVTAAGEESMALDAIVIASGHTWPEAPQLGEARLVSPWPFTNITALPAGRLAILGSSLSAIDAVLALGHAHGSFEETDGEIAWRPSPGAEDLHVTMVSATGVLPEGDFYYPFPYAPLRHLTDEAVREEVARGTDRLLGRVFDLLIREIAACDPDYLARLGPQSRTIAGFAAAYFEQRQDRGGRLSRVRDDFAKLRGLVRQKKTVEHRYALLRGHEKFDLAIRHLDERDLELFRQHLMPVFSDCYAAVPHLSLARLLAMDAAGAVSLVEASRDADYSGLANGGVQVRSGGRTMRFEAMIDGRGQQTAAPADLPFPSLVSELVDDTPLEAPFRLRLSDPGAGPVYCLAIAQRLDRHPFSQGLANCDELAAIVARDLKRSLSEARGPATSAAR